MSLPVCLSEQRPDLCGLGSPVWRVWPQYAAPPAEPRGHLSPAACSSHWPQSPPAPGQECTGTLSCQTEKECLINTTKLWLHRSRWLVHKQLTSAAGRCGGVSVSLSLQSFGPPHPVPPLIPHQSPPVCETLTNMKQRGFTGWFLVLWVCFVKNDRQGRQKETEH